MELPPINATIAKLGISWSLTLKLRDGASNVLLALVHLAELLCLGILLFTDLVLIISNATLVTQVVLNVSVVLLMAVPDVQQGDLQRHPQQLALLVEELAYLALPEMYPPTI